jgi:hypothetical protein
MQVARDQQRLISNNTRCVNTNIKINLTNEFWPQRFQSCFVLALVQSCLGQWALVRSLPGSPVIISANTTYMTTPSLNIQNQPVWLVVPIHWPCSTRCPNGCSPFCLPKPLPRCLQHSPFSTRCSRPPRNSRQDVPNHLRDLLLYTTHRVSTPIYNPLHLSTISQTHI